MTWNLAEIATLVNGQLVGDASPICCGANPPAQARDGDITLLDDPKRIDLIEQCPAIAVVVAKELELLDRPQIIVNHPHEAFAAIVAKFRPPIGLHVSGQTCDAEQLSAESTIAPSAIIHPTAVIGDGVKIGKRTQIMPGAIIMPRCQIGNDCVVHPNVTLYEYTELGDRVVIHAGSVIGAHGFGYRQENGKHIKSAQLGFVAIESDVEIGAAVTIDRGTYGATRIGEGTKIDNQVQIAHNCQIGKHNLLCSQVGIAGSCRTGDYVIMAGQVGLADHIHIGEHAIIGAQAGVMEDFEGHQVYVGSPATKQRDQMQIWAVQRRLPEMRRELKQLRLELNELKNEAQQNDRRAA